MKVEVVLKYRVQKLGLTPEECEDACDYKERPKSFAAAVSDGATEAVFAQRWAQLLAQRYVFAPRHRALSQKWLEPASRDLSESLDLASLPWYVLQKLCQGSAATLAGLVIDLEKRRFSCHCRGDSCIAWIDGAGAERVVPIDSPSALNNSPELISNILERNPPIPPLLHQQPLPPGISHFFLMTDALAGWYLQARLDQESPWEDLLSLREPEVFEKWLKERRVYGEIRNDDVALLGIRVHNDLLPSGA